MSRITVIGCFVVSLLICFMLPYHLTGHLRLDMRNIPVVLGGLYLRIGPLLSILAILVLGIYGFDPGFWANFLLYTVLAIMLWRLYPWFSLQSPKRRILMSVILCFIISVANLAAMEIINPPHKKIDVWLAYLTIPPLGAGIISYAIELVRKNHLLRQHLIKSKKLEAVEQMGAAISHEIRNPLTAAMGFVQLLLQDDSLLKYKRYEYLSFVKGELESAERVIQDYLTFSKPSLAKVEELNVKRELSQVLTILQPMANQNSVEILTEFAAIGFIQGDRQKFHQCFLNVIKNAIEAMPNGGTLTVKTEFNQHRVKIIVVDTGIGMTKEQVGRLGEPYYTTKEIKGTGLGMMVVFSIVRVMKGTLRVESHIGKGTAFYFSFPSLIPSIKNEGF
ncbi:HAMP domain-containing sensor histidine kinase [Bacillus sp. T33-2]|uniref:HAMP domain-containing sensor histidine kinase n=1 Tax=Bacillus sp. T33-2 TaxID=2054168 RepID=UPI0026BC60E4|nr:HAMP domain-containing sensor histidine kinase [Bacillus sp. T33-2]